MPLGWAVHFHQGVVKPSFSALNYTCVTILHCAAPHLTMLLLQLPPEIFYHIVSHLVTDAGILEAWKYRKVCRKFHVNFTKKHF